MDKSARSILAELKTFVPEVRKEDAIEARGQHIISSALYLFETIDSLYDEETASQIKNRFLSSIKTAEPEKFTKSFKRIKQRSEYDK